MLSYLRVLSFLLAASVVAGQTVQPCPAEASGNAIGSTCQPGTEDYPCFQEVSTSYDKYSAGQAVKSSSPDESFPKSFANDGWRPYAESVLIPCLVFAVCCCCWCCCLCIYNCKMCGKLNNDGCCVPSESWATKNHLKIVAWGMLASAGVLWLALNIVSLEATRKASTQIADLPDAIAEYSQFLENTLLPTVECVKNTSTEIASEATLKRDTGCGTCSASDINNLNIAITASNTISSSLTEVETTLKSFSTSIKDVVQDMRKSTENGAQQFHDFMTSVLSIILILGVISVLLAFLAGRYPSHGSKGKLLQCWSLGMALFMWVIFIVVFISFVILRFTAGFCEKPFENMGNLITAPTPQYYIKCSIYSDEQRAALWPFRTEQCNALDGITQLTTAANNINSANVDKTTLQELINEIKCSVAGDQGVLGYNGYLGCSVIDRFLQAVVDSLCDGLFIPMHTLAVCAFILGVTIIWMAIIQTLLRRMHNKGLIGRSASTRSEAYEMEEKGYSRKSSMRSDLSDGDDDDLKYNQPRYNRGDAPPPHTPPPHYSERKMDAAGDTRDF